MFKKLIKPTLAAIALAGIISIIPTTPTSAAACPDVTFVFARGSGSNLGAGDEQAWRAALETYLKDTTLTYDFYELGTTPHGGAQYPAAAIGIDSTTNFLTALGALVSAGESFSFGSSVEQGTAELKNYLAETAVACPNTKFVLGGYSQGAMVVSKSLPSLNADQLIYAATFGDPKLYLPEGNTATSAIPEACYGKNLSTYRAYVPNCRAYEGILGSYRPYTPESLSLKTGAWCNGNDVMCTNSLSLSDHLAYISDNLYKDAANTIAKKLAAAFPAKTAAATTSSTHDTAILIDTTGSMSSLIKTYKKEALRLASETLNSGGRIALYEYRDLSDPFETVQHCDFTCTYEEFSTKLNNLNTTGGGDTNESALSAMMNVMNTLKWQKGATKSIVLLTDAGYHLTDYDGTTLADVTKRSLEIDPVNIYAVTSVPEAYKELTTATNGQTFNINSKDQLTFSTTVVMSRPTAVLPLESYYGAPGTTFTFDASASTAEAEIDHYEWDLDCDGIFEFTTTTPVKTKTYLTETTGFVQVKVVDKNGLSSTMSATLTVSLNPFKTPTTTPETPATITDLKAAKINDQTYLINFETSKNTAKVIVILNNAILGYTTETSFQLTDVTPDTTLRLVPISTSDTRGTAAEITLATTKNSSLATALSAPSLKAPNSGRR